MADDENIQNLTALCGKCLVAAKGPVEHDDDSIFSCPECGRSDTLANIMSEIGDHARDQVAKQLNDQMRRAQKSTGFIQIKVKPFDEPERNYRFVSDFEN